jgi:hypothetical protein
MNTIATVTIGTSMPTFRIHVITEVRVQTHARTGKVAWQTNKYRMQSYALVRLLSTFFCAYIITDSGVHLSMSHECYYGSAPDIKPNCNHAWNPQFQSNYDSCITKARPGHLAIKSIAESVD